MWQAIIATIAAVVSGKAGERIGGAVASTAEAAAVLAAVAPVALWLSEHKEDIFVTVSYGDLAFWGSLLGGVLFLVVRLVHYAPPPNR